MTEKCSCDSSLISAGDTVTAAQQRSRFGPERWRFWVRKLRCHADSRGLPVVSSEETWTLVTTMVLEGRVYDKAHGPR